MACTGGFWCCDVPCTLSLLGHGIINPSCPVNIQFFSMNFNAGSPATNCTSLLTPDGGSSLYLLGFTSQPAADEYQFDRLYTADGKSVSILFKVHPNNTSLLYIKYLQVSNGTDTIIYNGVPGSGSSYTLTPSGTCSGCPVPQFNSFYNLAQVIHEDDLAAKTYVITFNYPGGDACCDTINGIPVTMTYQSSIVVDHYSVQARFLNQSVIDGFLINKFFDILDRSCVAGTNGKVPGGPGPCPTSWEETCDRLGTHHTLGSHNPRGAYHSNLPALFGTCTSGTIEVSG